MNNEGAGLGVCDTTPGAVSQALCQIKEKPPAELVASDESMLKMGEQFF